jgi:hypothetical protein
MSVSSRTSASSPVACWSSSRVMVRRTLVGDRKRSQSVVKTRSSSLVLTWLPLVEEELRSAWPPKYRQICAGKKEGNSRRFRIRTCRAILPLQRTRLRRGDSNGDALKDQDRSPADSPHCPSAPCAGDAARASGGHSTPLQDQITLTQGGRLRLPGDRPHTRRGRPEGLVVDRRAFLGTLTLGLLAAPLAAEAQPQAKTARIGFLSLSPGPTWRPSWLGSRWTSL